MRTRRQTVPGLPLHPRHPLRHTKNHSRRSALATFAHPPTSQREGRQYGWGNLIETGVITVDNPGILAHFSGAPGHNCELRRPNRKSVAAIAALPCHPTAGDRRSLKTLGARRVSSQGLPTLRASPMATTRDSYVRLAAPRGTHNNDPSAALSSQAIAPESAVRKLGLSGSGFRPRPSVVFGARS